MSASFLDRMINDVTTSPEAAPEFGNGIPAYPRTALASKQKRAYPAVQPLNLQLPADQVFAAVKTAAAAMDGWTIEEADETRKRLRAIARTPVLGFKDDIVVIVEESAGGSVVQMRSRSRHGKSDFGANAKRIVAFLERVSASSKI